MVTAPSVFGRREVAPLLSEFLTRYPTVTGELTLADLAHIHFTALHASREWRFVHRGRALRVPLRPGFATNSADAAIGHAERGGGVAMVLAYQVVDAVAAGRLQVVLPTFEAPPLPIQVVYPSARLLSAAVRGFVDLVVARRGWRFVELAGPGRRAAR